MSLPLESGVLCGKLLLQVEGKKTMDIFDVHYVHEGFIYPSGKKQQRSVEFQG